MHSKFAKTDYVTVIQLNTHQPVHDKCVFSTHPMTESKKLYEPKFLKITFQYHSDTRTLSTGD